MIFGLGKTPTGTAVVIGITVEELRTLLEDIGRTVHGNADDAGVTWTVVAFSAESDEHARSLVDGFAGAG